jgi:heme oxygenase (biliverdin-IX-beta and delta-forming)
MRSAASQASQARPLEPTVTAPLAQSTLTLREALRASTRSRHDALDRALMPHGAAWTRGRYQRFLRGTLAVVETLEPAIAALLPEIVPVEAPSRAARLRRDLRALGDDCRVAPVALDLSDRPAAFGAAYVLEGSMLGGQYVAQAVARDLRVDDASLTYLRPPGGGVGPRWKAFVAALDAFGATVAPAVRRSAEAAAMATFAAFAEAFRREGLF